MNSLASLLAQVPQVSSSRLVSNGVACWVCYPQPLAASFFQSLSEMGGWSMAEEQTQSLWFFPGTLVLTGLARLYNWARLNPIAATIIVFECSLIVSKKFEHSLAIKSEFSTLEVGFSKRLAVRVSAHLRELGRGMTGLSFKQVQFLDGLQGSWFDLEPSEQVSVAPSTNWVWLVRPVGPSSDKVFVKGWRSFIEQLEPSLAQNKVVLQQGENHVLMLKISSLRTLARLIMEIMSLLSDPNAVIWPCQHLIMGLDGPSLSADFSRKIEHLFEAMEAGALYMPLTTVFQIADPRLSPIESRFSLSHTKITDFFQVQVLTEGGVKRHGTLNILLPSALVRGTEAPCFYCGLRSHLPAKCPSRRIQPINRMVGDLERFGQLDLGVVPDVFQALEQRLSDNLLQNLTDLLMDKGDQAVAVGALFAVNQICQLRTLHQVWRARGKAWPEGIHKLSEPGEDLIWAAFDSMRLGRTDLALQQLEQCMLQSPKSYQPRVLQGFLAMERGDLKRAAGYWSEAERLAHTDLQRSYLQLLQARLLEIQGLCQEALALYGKALRESPRFWQARYRQAVCLVKLGFLAEAQGVLRDLIQQDPDCFSAVLLDPELEPGHTPILAELWDIWQEVGHLTTELVGSVESLPDLLNTWLPSSHDTYRYFAERIQELSMYFGINNYVAAAKLIRGALLIRDEIQIRVKKDIKELGTKRTEQFSRLLEIQHEASWFPFPRLLRQFNLLFNRCADQLQTIDQLDLYIPDKFKLAHETVRETGSTLKKLERKLLWLQAIRNGALFTLLFGKNLLIFESMAIIMAGALALALFLFFPNHVFFGQDLGRNRWLVLNLCLIIFSFIAVIGAVLRTSTRFDVYKNKILGNK